LWWAGATGPSQLGRGNWAGTLGPGTVARMDPWGPDQASTLASLCARALPGERLSADELLATCWEDGGVVLGDAGGDAALAGVVRSFGSLRLAWVKLAAVAPERQRRGLGSALLAAFEQRAFEEGAAEIHLAGSAPAYLWPGVPTDALAMLCLAEAHRYEPTGAELNMVLSSAFRARAPDGIAIRRVLDQRDVDAVERFVERHWPEWVPELRQGVEQGGTHAAFADGAGGRADDGVAGFACHSVNRVGWIGPMGTDPGRRGGGIGHALLGGLCEDLMVAGIETAEISWVGPLRFYAKAGASVGRVFRTFRKRRP
jgi:mycothiol synthase